MSVKDTNAHAHIPTSEIRQDILDTEREILQMMREITGFELLRDRISLMKAHARQAGIKDRKEFILKLQEILKLRGEQK